MRRSRRTPISNQLVQQDLEHVHVTNPLDRSYRCTHIELPNQEIIKTIPVDFSFSVLRLMTRFLTLSTALASR